LKKDDLENLFKASVRQEEIEWLHRTQTRSLHTEASHEEGLTQVWFQDDESPRKKDQIFWLNVLLWCLGTGFIVWAIKELLTR
jgi:antibiotic biosynthesis monooxygenase (ABM) superfamily enzyme